jgi:hypothetical protein
MKEAWVLPLTLGAVATTAIAIGLIMSYSMKQSNLFESTDLFQRDMDKPCLWIFYDTSIPNARAYSDFHSRSSRALNLPFMNLCYESIAKHNAGTYRIQAISGLADLAELLGGWEQLPEKFQNPLLTLEPADTAWVRAAVLAKFGGLWVAPTTICLKPFGTLPNKPVFFGSDSDETFVGTAGTVVPNFQVAWSPKPNDPLWAAWEAKARARLSSSGGGDTARSADKWEFVALSNQFPELEVRPLAEVSRKGAAGRRIQIEDLLASGQEGDLPFTISCLGIYVPIPWPELKVRRAYGWFLRMSEDQIAESDLVIRDLYKISGVI